MVNYTDSEQDVPSPIDLRDPVDARTWADAAETRPGRPQVRAAIAHTLAQLALRPDGARVLELGSGPGFLAEVLLSQCPNIASYTLLDFSQPMLDISRERLESSASCSRAATKAQFVLGDFKAPDWHLGLAKPYDAVVAMQSVHEIRHKRHVPGLYRQIRELLVPGGLLMVADHIPKDDSLRWVSLHMTEAEQLAALRAAGFADPRPALNIERIVLVVGNA